MNKIIMNILLSTAFAFSSMAGAAEPKAIDAAATAEKAEKPKKKHRHRPTPDGPISLDVIESNGTVHVLLGKSQQNKKSLWYQQSADSGSTWSQPVKIHQDDFLEANFRRGSDAQLAVQGNTIFAIWASRKEGNGRHNSGPMSAVRSTDNGKTWQAAAIPADSNEIAHNFLEMDGNSDTISAVWLDRREPSTPEKRGKKGLRHAQSTDGGLTWSQDQTLDDKTCACCWNTAKYSADKELFVLYRDQIPSDMSIGVLDKQAQWSKLNTVGDFDWDFPGCPHIGGGLAFQNNSGLMHSTVGTGHADHKGTYYLRSEDQGKTWSQPVQLGDEGAVHSDVAASEDGRVIAVWDMHTEDGLAVFYAESNDKGLSWSDSKRISKAGLRATHPLIVFSGTKFLTLWTESADGKTQALQMQQL